MNKKAPGLPIFLALSLAATCTALQADLHSHAKSGRTDPAWREYMSAMDKMHATMASVESSGNPDLDFTRLMLPHHQAAIDMAKTELLYGQDPQLRRLAQEIVTDQESEIELMQLWIERPPPASEKADKGSSQEQKREQ
ncbi:MAG: DUF305 domain-containing protein [Candidatus Acidiferrum sp.]